MNIHLGLRAARTRWPGRFVASLALLLSVVCLSNLGLAQKRPESTQGPSVSSRTPEFSAGADAFTGPERCRECHKEVATEYGKTTHAKLTFPGKDYIQGCEACHGPGKAHSDAVRGAHGDDAAIAKALKDYPLFAFRAAAGENTARCLTCHNTSKQQDFFAHSEHAGHSISCDQCHTAHLVDEVKDKSRGDLSYPQ